MPEKIRFAVLCTGASLTLPAVRMIERLLEHPDTVCAAILELGAEPPLPDSSAWSLYRRWYAAQARFSADERFPGIPRIDCPLSACPLAEITALKLDFILQTASIPLETNLADTARHGVWALSFGQPPAFSEMEHANPHLVVSLERLGAPPQVLRQGVVNALRRSYADTLHNAVTAGIDFPALVVRQMLRTGTLPSCGAPAPTPQPPSTSQVVRFHAGQMLAWAQYQWSETIRSEMWNVGIVNAPIHTFLDGRYPAQIEWLQPLGSKKFVADPFALPTAQGLQLLAEEFDYDRYQGYITSAHWRPNAPLAENHTVIDENVHMSYPFPLTHQGRRYCIPECQARREVALYCMEEGSGRWEKTAVLIRGFAALDSTVIQHDGKWWLFCSCHDDLRDTKLYIWHAAGLFGPWEPHTMNPVKCDIRSSRPGGTPFVHNGQWYRPAQDSSTSYGCAMSINRIVRLTADEFIEETVAHISPPANAFYRDGFHTLSSAGPVTVLDGKRMTPIMSLALRRLLHKFKRLARL